MNEFIHRMAFESVDVVNQFRLVPEGPGGEIFSEEDYVTGEVANLYVIFLASRALWNIRLRCFDYRRTEPKWENLLKHAMAKHPDWKPTQKQIDVGRKIAEHIFADTFVDSVKAPQQIVPEDTSCLAYEIWTASQVLPIEGIPDAVNRIADILIREKEIRNDK